MFETRKISKFIPQAYPRGVSANIEITAHIDSKASFFVKNSQGFAELGKVGSVNHFFQKHSSWLIGLIKRSAWAVGNMDVRKIDRFIVFCALDDNFKCTNKILLFTSNCFCQFKVVRCRRG